MLKGWRSHAFCLQEIKMDVIRTLWGICRKMAGRVGVRLFFKKKIVFVLLFQIDLKEQLLFPYVTLLIFLPFHHPPPFPQMGFEPKTSHIPTVALCHLSRTSRSLGRTSSSKRRFPTLLRDTICRTFSNDEFPFAAFRQIFSLLCGRALLKYQLEQLFPGFIR